MPICKKCNTLFPNRIVINGLTKILNKRKYCLECSPYGEHNTRNINDVSKHEKKCPRCLKIKNLNEFYKRKYKDNTRPSAYCIDCTIELKAEDAVKIKQKCVDYKGGSCVICGYNKYIGALQFHHIDKNKKQFSISLKISSYSFEKLKNELDKCILVCSRCHSEIEAGLVDIPY